MDTTEENFGRDSKTNEKLGKSIYQLYTELPTIQGRVIQASSWVIHGMPVGLSFRENIEGDTFVDFSPFLPHHVKGKGGATFEFKTFDDVEDIRRELYKSFNPSSLYEKNSMKVEYVNL